MLPSLFRFRNGILVYAQIFIKLPKPRDFKIKISWNIAIKRQKISQKKSPNYSGDSATMLPVPFTFYSRKLFLSELVSRDGNRSITEDPSWEIQELNLMNKDGPVSVVSFEMSDNHFEHAHIFILIVSISWFRKDIHVYLNLLKYLVFNFDKQGIIVLTYIHKHRRILCYQF